MYLKGFNIDFRIRKKQQEHSLLQNLAISRLRITEVHHFVQQLVNDDEIVADRFFFQFFEVLAKNLKRTNVIAE